MSKQTWSFGRLDDFPPGPWTGEPDKVGWVDPETDLDCLIVRNRMGALCGYVGLPPGHPLHGADYEEPDVQVHGGLTYAAPCQEDQEKGVCHVPEPGRPADVFWLGFDCNHCGDLSPMDMKYNNGVLLGEEYRDISYVEAECTKLAQQLAALSAR